MLILSPLKLLRNLSIISIAAVIGILCQEPVAFSATNNLTTVHSTPQVNKLLNGLKKTSAQGSVVGDIPDKFSVTPGGQAHYSLTIDVPPGTNKMAPALYLTYDSSNSNLHNGLVGMGFALEGLTVITRCQSNKAQNGGIHGIDFSDQDRFCLNGEQLVAIKGSYGQDGTEYRTYHDMQARIISHGRQGNGPATFTVETKGGQIAQYAMTADSQVKAQGKDSVEIWALNKVQDTSGNYFTARYVKDETLGSFYPVEINYTGNDKAKLAPYNSVKFIYEERPDVSVTYRSGSKNTLNTRLKNIQAFQGSNLVYDYRLTYEVSKNSYRSRLISVQKFSGDGTYLPAMKFAWQTNEEGWEDAQQYTPPDLLYWDGQPYGQFMDLNGDGLPDYTYSAIHGGARYGHSFINTGNGWQDGAQFNLPDILSWDGQPYGQLIDLNGDGLPDYTYAAIHGGARYGHSFINTGNGWKDGTQFNLPDILSWDGQPYGQLIDLNGDGLPDYTYSAIHGGYRYGHSFINTGNGWQDGTQFNLPDILSWDGQPYGELVDLNGDGLPDYTYAAIHNNVRYGHSFINTGNGWKDGAQFNLPDILSWNGQPYGQFVDLNGDGIPDFVIGGTHGGIAYKHAWLNSGNGWQDAPQLSPPDIFNWDGQPYGQFVDLNGDGIPDFVIGGARGGVSYRHAWLNSGNGWHDAPQLSPPDIFNWDGQPYGQFVDLNGDGIPDFVIAGTHGAAGYRHAWLNRAKKFPDYLTSITDGLGATTTIDYEPLSGKAINVYTKENDAKYPNMDWQGPMYVVYQTITNADINDPKAIARVTAQGTKNDLNHVTTYHYIGAKFNHLGWGFLGFHQVAVTDATTGITKTTTYSQDPEKHNIGKEIFSETRLNSGEVIHSNSATWDFKKVYGDGSPNVTVYFPFISTAQENSYDLTGKLLSIKTIADTYDDYANPVQVKETVNDPNTTETFTTVTVNNYRSIVDSNHWLLGELLRSATTAMAPNVGSETHTAVFTYDDNGLLVSETTEPNYPLLSIIKNYTRDTFGNIIQTEITNGDKSIDRITKTQYDEQGAFIIGATNALGQKTTQTVDQRFGTPLTATDLNGLITTTQYDGFGHLLCQIHPDNTGMQQQLYWVANPPKDAPNAVYAEKIDVTGHPSVIKYYDQLNRLIAKTTVGFDGRNVWQTTQYDELDRVTRSSLPYFDGEQALYITHEYDVLGRLTQTIIPDGSKTTLKYEGLTTTTTNALDQNTIKIANVRGKLIKSFDNKNKAVSYQYDAYGRLIAMSDSNNNVTKMSYDRLGRKLTEVDPDKGSYKYEYDVLGNLTKQTDANGNVTTMQYDALDHIIARTDAKGTSAWVYGNDLTQHNVGLLVKEEGLANVTQSKNGIKITSASLPEIHAAHSNGIESYTKTISYDQYARIAAVNLKLNGNDYLTQTQYDDLGRVIRTVYPNQLTVQNEYNALGYLSAVTDGATGGIFWQVNAMDARGNIISETHSNGLITTRVYDPATGLLKEIHSQPGTRLQLQNKLFGNMGHKPEGVKPKNQTGAVQSLIYSYDRIGNLKTLDDKVNNIEETFDYDSLNRIISYQSTTGSSQRNKAYQYDDLGNMIYQTGLGKYIYDGIDGAGPHAVTAIVDDGKLVGQFRYDRDGNQIAAVLNGKTRTINYTSYEKPLSITTDQATSEFFYNADREQFERIDQIKKDGKLLKVTTVNFGNYEHEVYDDGTQLHYHDKIYIGPNTEIVTDASSPNSQVAIFELLKDKLGSLTTITDEAGNIVRSYHYEPFGKKELIGTYQDVTPPVTHHGFTGHQEIEGLDLIHMDGRLYDPILARFLSADPYIQDPTNTQSLNRYSYCLNNPLFYTDPSGFGWLSDFFDGICDLFRDIGHAIADVLENRYFQLAMAILVPWKFGLDGIYLALFEGTYSAFNTALAGGNIGDIVKAGIISGALTRLNELGKNWDFSKAEFGSREWAKGVVVKGLEGGGIRVIQGGSFQDGFVAAAVTQAFEARISTIDETHEAGIVLHSAANGIVAGTAAALNGGSFVDAAQSAAFDHLRAQNIKMAREWTKGQLQESPTWQHWEQEKDKIVDNFKQDLHGLITSFKQNFQGMSNSLQQNQAQSDHTFTITLWEFNSSKHHFVGDLFKELNLHMPSMEELDRLSYIMQALPYPYNQ